MSDIFSYTVERLPNMSDKFPTVVVHLYLGSNKITTVDINDLYESYYFWSTMWCEKISETYAGKLLEYAHVVGKQAVESHKKYITEGVDCE